MTTEEKERTRAINRYNLNVACGDEKRAALEWELCKRDPWHWIYNWVWTLDTHDKKCPKKWFPDKEYIKRFVEVYQKEDLLLVPKSRQMMLTWICVSLFLHEAIFNNGRYLFMISKKEKDADDLVQKRIKYIYDQLPKFMQPKVVFTFCNANFPDNNCVIHGFPQGADQIRSQTASTVLVDEAAFQPEAESTYEAIKPSIDGGGKIIMISSANPGFFERLVNDKTEMADK